MEVSEQEKLVRACQAGDKAAFGELYESFIRPIYDFIFYKTHHKETAEDLTSQIFFKAFDTIDRFDSGQGTFSSWIYRIARNTVIDFYRTRKHHTNLEDAWDINDGSDIARDVDIAVQLEKVQKILAGFSTDERDIVLMRLWQGMSYAEIAPIVGKKEPAIRMIVSRVLVKLRSHLSPLILVTCYILLGHSL